MTGSPRTPIAAAIACAAAFAGVFFFAFRVAAGSNANGDIVRAMMHLDGSWGGPIASAIAHSVVVVVPLALIAMLGLAAARGRRREALAGGALAGVAIVAAELIKVALDNAGIRSALGLGALGAHHFPSGHATATTALALAAVLVVRAGRRRLALIASGAYAAAVCASVLILGWHLPSDVLGGILLASFCFCATLVALRLSGAPAAPLRGELAVPPE